MSIQTELRTDISVSNLTIKLKTWLFSQISRSSAQFNTNPTCAKTLKPHTTAQTCAQPTEFSDLCHSLRTPLNAIIGFSELMKAQIYGPLGHNKYQDYSCAISKSGEELLAQIEHLLNERGQHLPIIEIQEFNTNTQNAVNSLKSIANQATHHLITPAANNNSVSIH